MKRFHSFLWYRKVYSIYHCEILHSVQDRPSPSLKAEDENCTLRLLPKAIFLISLSLLACIFNVGWASEIEEKEQAIKEALFITEVAQPKVLKIGLVDCITYALKNNSEIKIEKIEPLIAKEDVKSALSIFEPTLSLEGSLEDSKIESPSILAGSHTRTGEFNLGIDGKLSPGTEYNIDFLNQRYKTNSAYLSVNPYYESEFAITIIQPLFKDFGTIVNRADIIIANNDLDKSNQNLKKEIIDTISSVKEAYYNYVLNIEKYKTAQISLQRAKDLLDILQKRQAKGMVSSIDILEAKTGVAEREDELLNIQLTIKGDEDNLKYVTGLVNDPQLWHAQIEPLDRPGLKEEPLDLVENLQQAFEFRPDYQASKIELKSQNIRIQVKKNATLPTIDLVGSLGLNGLDKDYDGALKADYKKWSTGVKVSFPWGNKEALADHEQANLTKRQLLISFEQLQQNIILEVRDAVRQVNIAQQKIATAKERVDTEIARYRAIERRFQEGLVNAHDMLEYQEDLSNAETNLIQSLIDYSTSIVNLEKMTGVTLVRNNIKMEE